MGHTLIIAEKPSLGRDIAAALPGIGESKDGCIYKGDYIVTWVYGHMLALKQPEDYDEGYKKWNPDVLPIYFPNWGQKIGDDTTHAPGQMTKKQRVNQIGRLLKDADMVIHAGDPDDEGQLLIDELLRWFKYKGPVKRLDTGNTTKPALQKALRHMRDNAQCESEGWAAYGRSIADLMVGVNMSRYFTCNNGTLLTVGRVQTPTLGLVVNRGMQIENHVKQKYYNILADLDITNKSVQSKYIPDKADTHLVDGRITDPAYAEEIRKNINNASYTNSAITKRMVSEAPPLPFNLVKLQTYCSNKFGYNPSDVMAITQSLRENYKAITYNRSDCQYLSEEHYKEAPDTIKQVLANLNENIPETDTNIHSKCFNDANITAHFAIIPTNIPVSLSKLTERERNVYQAICKFYLIQFMPPARKEKTKLEIKLPDNGVLQANSTKIVNTGYLKYYKDKDEETSALSDIPAGMYTSKVTNTSIQEKETTPPPRHTKASLNEDMTCIAKYVTDPKIKELLLEKDKDKKGENGSIGTSATRSGIIDALVKRGFLEENGKKLISTPIGRELYRILPEEIKYADMTAKWWTIQEDIKTGTKPYTALTENVLETITKIVHSSYPKIDSRYKKGNGKKMEIVGQCPVCGGNVVETASAFSCANWKDQGCKFAIWKKSKASLFSKLTVTTPMTKKLLKGERVKTSKLYSIRTDKTFEGEIELKNTAGYGYQLSMVPFDEVAPKPTIGKCPMCGGDIIETQYAFSCANWKEKNCKFALWKKSKAPLFSKVMVTQAMAKNLLNGEHIKVKNLYSPNKGTTFEGTIYLRNDPEYGHGLGLERPDEFDSESQV